MPPTTATLQVPALDCPEEFRLIERGLMRVEGIGALEPDFLSRRLRVEYDPGQLSADAVAERVRRLGFPAVIETGTQVRPAESLGLRRSTIVAGVLLAAAFAAYLWESEVGWSAAVLAIASTLVAGAPVARAAWRAVRLRALDMNALMTVAATGAIATGDYFEAATAMFLFGVALWLESFSLERARRAVKSLLEFAPTVAHRLTAAGTEDIDPLRLAVGDRVLVKPGERIPVDGAVERGASSVNQAPITGESLPVDKSAGDRVFAGTLNGEGSLEILVERGAAETTLAQIARLVEQAQSTRSPTERFVDLFARKYTPAVIVLALLLAVVPPLVAWSPLPDAMAAWARAVSPVDWLHRGLVLLVIACPCALVISTPVTIVCGLNAAARRGVLVKGGQHLESAGQVQCVAFDKTGTLTTGRATVVEVAALAGSDRAEVLRLASSLEVHSEHPLATAIVAVAKAEGVSPGSVDGFAALRGFGIEGQVDGRNVVCGNLRLLERAGYPRDQIDRFVAELASRRPTAVQVLVGADGKLIGAILLADPAREDAAAVVSQLRASSIEHVTMLSGDSQAVADFVAHEIGIDDARGELLPENKVQEVSRLAVRYPRLAMVGDGVNDAPALAAARLGIAFGAGASDTALETADVVVMNDKLGRIAELFNLGRKTRRRLGENIAASLAIKAIVLLLAALGLATMWMAVAADVGASLLVIANGMRLLQHGSAESLAA